MADTKFDSKSFNPEAFGKYVDRIPNVKKNELAKSGAVGSTPHEPHVGAVTIRPPEAFSSLTASA